MADHHDLVLRDVKATGVVFTGRCEIRSATCSAKEGGAVTAVWDEQRQVDVCGHCIEAMVRAGEWRIAGARFRSHADVAVLDADGRPLLIVEVKKRPPFLDDEDSWAKRVRRNLLVHGALPPAEYFMVLMHPGHAHLWCELEVPDLDAEPLATWDPTEEIKRTRQGPPAPASLEDAVAEWLRQALAAQPPPDWAVRSGVAQKARDTVVEWQYVPGTHGRSPSRLTPRPGR